MLRKFALLGGLAFASDADARQLCVFRDQNTGAAALTLPSVVTIDDAVWTVDGVACTVKNRRVVHERRAYVDLACDDGRLLLFDVNRLDGTRLLLNERPLGGAALYRVQSCKPDAQAP